MLNITAISNEECQYFVYRYIEVHDSFLCAISPRGKGMCKVSEINFNWCIRNDIIFQGDSGGPIVHENELVGIINWAIPFAMGYPEGYARLSVYYNWIVQNTKHQRITMHI